VTHESYVRIVPGVVVHERRSVGHSGDLVAVVPPGHHPRVLIRVLPQPVVGLTEVVQNVAATIKLISKNMIKEMQKH